MSANIVGRFAPSPSGYLHIGNLLAMLLAWLDCRSLGGELIFRMEDLDPARSKRAYIDALAEDLRWLGLDWDRGWPDPAYAQSGRAAHYEAAFRTLREKGLVYPCWCTRSERLAAASAPHPGEAEHDGSCRCARLTPSEREARLLTSRPPAWKLKCPDETITLTDEHYGPISQNPARDVGDFLIRRADGVFAYQLAVSVDDMAMRVTRVVRGRDLLSSAPRQQSLDRDPAADAPAGGAGREARLPLRPVGGGQTRHAAGAARGFLVGAGDERGYPGRPRIVSVKRKHFSLRSVKKP